MKEFRKSPSPAGEISRTHHRSLPASARPVPVPPAVCTATLMSDPPCTLGFVDAFHSINSPYDYWLRD